MLSNCTAFSIYCPRTTLHPTTRAPARSWERVVGNFSCSFLSPSLSLGFISLLSSPLVPINRRFASQPLSIIRAWRPAESSHHLRHTPDEVSDFSTPKSPNSIRVRPSDFILMRSTFAGFLIDALTSCGGGGGSPIWELQIRSS